MTATPVVLDCDPGHDDMVAIMLAAAHPAIDLRAITVVAGNGTLENCLANALATCSMAGIGDVPVAAGAAGPLVGRLRTAEFVHGSSALDGADLGPATVRAQDEHAVDLMARVVRDSPVPVTFVGVGPLTNLALFLRLHPGLAGRVREIVVMGGTMGAGNVAPLAEFNIVVDPEAADAVVRSGLPVTLCPLDVTHQALATPDVLARLAAQRTPLADTVGRLLTFFADRYRDVFGMPSPPLHDPVAVARVIDPAVVGCVDAHVAVELRGEHTRGATVCDRIGVLGREPNAKVTVDLDSRRFWELVLQAVAVLGAT